MPNIYMIAGPNGAGKTTSAMNLLPEIMHCEEYVNADAIAAGLSPFKPEGAAIQAGKLMLSRIHQLASQKQDFAFETTAASRSFVPFLKKCKEEEYCITLLYLWLNSPELAIRRVAERVKNGGHDIPVNVIRRRYKKGLENFFKLYIPIAEQWALFDNSNSFPGVIAQKYENNIVINNPTTWQNIRERLKI